MNIKCFLIQFLGRYSHYAVKFFNDTVVKEQKNPESPNGMRGKMRMEEMDSPNSCLLGNRTERKNY